MNLWRILIVAGWMSVLPMNVCGELPLPGIAVDSVLHWSDPLSLTPAEFAAALPQGSDGMPLFRKIPQKAKAPDGSEILVLALGGKDAKDPLVWGSKRWSVASVLVAFQGQKCVSLVVRLRARADGGEVRDEVLSELNRLLKRPPKSWGASHAANTKEGLVPSWWEEGGTTVIDLERSNYKNETVVQVSRTTSPMVVSTGPSQEPPMDGVPVAVVQNLGPMAGDAELDALLRFDEVWKWSPEEFEKHFNTVEKDKHHIQFEWLNAAKDRARFSRRLLPPKECKLTMFSGAVKIEEVIVEFVKGRAARTTVSFYNRGDSGDITTAEFERIYKKVGLNLTEVLKMQPRSQLNSSNAALKTTGWNWTTPAGIAFLEYNDYTVRNASGATSKPEFLRLKLAAPDQADWSMGKLAVGVQRMALTKNVTKAANGDVYIAGVPMVDQGAKGYCVAASCQRLFEYMRIPCDQHEMAQLISADAGSGANIMVMQKSLAKVDSAFQVSFKPLVNPLNYYDSRHNRRVSLKEFSGIIKEHVDKGVPLLWGLALGEFPEEPPLPNSGQISGGHMRLVIGYNPVTDQVLFTDSWGAGHELKRTKARDAYEETLGLYSMSPRGL